jgi:ABC-type phosphate transport system auxiliary subunit
MSFAASPSPVPAVWVAEISVSLVALFGCCEKLIWVGVGYFWWEVIIKK